MKHRIIVQIGQDLLGVNVVETEQYDLINIALKPLEDRIVRAEWIVNHLASKEFAAQLATAALEHHASSEKWLMDEFYEKIHVFTDLLGPRKQ
jgi:hypothetical protein